MKIEVLFFAQLKEAVGCDTKTLGVDDGATVIGLENMAIGQYYAIGVDMRDPYRVIGGLQDNGIWIGPSNSRDRPSASVSIASPS